jgi:hypothetical protein
VYSSLGFDYEHKELREILKKINIVLDMPIGTRSYLMNNKNLMTLSFSTYSLLTTTANHKKYKIIPNQFFKVKICSSYEVFQNFAKDFQNKNVAKFIRMRST